MQNGEFQNDGIINLTKIFSYFYKENIRVNNKYILNQICDYLHIKEMLPAICFVFSRKNVIEFAKMIEYPLFTGKESHIPNIIEKECKHILMKLPNYREYVELPEYKELTKLLQKGIAVHHSGILPVLREMVEMLFSKGYIKLLFATETFAIGVNMPTKTALFTGVTKFDGDGFRNLLAHEYTQMAGRAGRRGKDVVGHVIHLVNMFEMPTLSEYQTMLNGVPQTLLSKFKIDFSLILRELKFESALKEGFTENQSLTSEVIVSKIKSFIQKSMINNEFQKEYNFLNSENEKLQSKIEELEISLIELRLQFDIDGNEISTEESSKIYKQFKELQDSLGKKF